LALDSPVNVTRGRLYAGICAIGFGVLDIRQVSERSKHEVVRGTEYTIGTRVNDEHIWVRIHKVVCQQPIKPVLVLTLATIARCFRSLSVWIHAFGALRDWRRGVYDGLDKRALANIARSIGSGTRDKRVS
jgi:hypothetical protein